MKINDIIGTISSLNDTIRNIEQQLVPLFTARRFLFLHLEFSDLPFQGTRTYQTALK